MKNTYWSGNGPEEAKHAEMEAANWAFSKAAINTFHSYYRYFNDGDLPGWARRQHGPVLTEYSGLYHGFRLNEVGLQMLEDRVTEAILKEYKRFQKTINR